VSSGCCRAAAVKARRKNTELADVVRLFGDEYRRSVSLPRHELKVLRDIELCRTARLGGHLYKCDRCGHEQPQYDSCRNRHCPKCQSLAKARWLDARRRELLPVGYFHVVFTLPHILNVLALWNKRLIYDLLFACASETLKQFAASGRHRMMGHPGITAILHTWDQRIKQHPHLHCVVSGGALSFDGQRWMSSRKKFLFPVRALSKVFRGKFLAKLEELYCKDKLRFYGEVAPLSRPGSFDRLLENLRRKEWIVYSKAPFATPEKVLNYLGSYTHRVAISNYRIRSVSKRGVSFFWRDRANGNRSRVMTLKGSEFLKRFMLHVLPKGYVRIRYYGLLAGSQKKANLAVCRRLLRVAPPPGQEKEAPPEKTARELFFEMTGRDIDICPCCGKGRMIKIAVLPPETGPPGERRAS